MLKTSGWPNDISHPLNKYDTHRVVGKDISQRTHRFSMYECFQCGCEKREIKALFISIICCYACCRKPRIKRVHEGKQKNGFEGDKRATILATLFKKWPSAYHQMMTKKFNDFT